MEDLASATPVWSSSAVAGACVFCGMLLVLFIYLFLLSPGPPVGSGDCESTCNVDLVYGQQLRPTMGCAQSERLSPASCHSPCACLPQCGA